MLINCPHTVFCEEGDVKLLFILDIYTRDDDVDDEPRDLLSGGVKLSARERGLFASCTKAP